MNTQKLRSVFKQLIRTDPDTAYILHNLLFKFYNGIFLSKPSILYDIEEHDNTVCVKFDGTVIMTMSSEEYYYELGKMRGDMDRPAMDLTISWAEVSALTKLLTPLYEEYKESRRGELVKRVRQQDANIRKIMKKLPRTCAYVYCDKQFVDDDPRTIYCSVNHKVYACNYRKKNSGDVA